MPGSHRVHPPNLLLATGMIAGDKERISRGLQMFDALAVLQKRTNRNSVLVFGHPQVFIDAFATLRRPPTMTFNP